MKSRFIIALVALPFALGAGLLGLRAKAPRVLPVQAGYSSLIVTRDNRYLAQSTNWAGQLVVLDLKTNKARAWNPKQAIEGGFNGPGANYLVQVGQTPFVAGLGGPINVGETCSIGLYDLRKADNFRVLAPQQAMKRSLAATPDGRTLVVAHRDGGLGFWDVRSGALKRRWTTFGKGETAPDALAISSDGKKLATGNYFMLYGADSKRSGTDKGQAPQIWDLATGRLIRTCQRVGYMASVRLPSARFSTWSVIDFSLLRFSPDGRLLATDSNNNGVAIWDTRTGKVKWLLVHPEKRRGDSISTINSVGGLAFSPDSKRVAAVSGFGIMDVFSLVTGKHERQFEGEGPIAWTSAGLFFKGGLLSSSRDKVFQLKL